MRKNKICTKEIKIGTQEILKYYINSLDAKDQSVIYEIVIEKWIEGRIEEVQKTGGLTDDYEKAADFLDKLYRNTVTPLCLLEVTDDCFYAMI